MIFILNPKPHLSKNAREKAVELERQAFNLRNSFTTKAATNETLFANRQIEVKKPRMKGGIMLWNWAAFCILSRRQHIFSRVWFMVKRGAPMLHSKAQTHKLNPCFAAEFYFIFTRERWKRLVRTTSKTHLFAYINMHTSAFWWLSLSWEYE